MSYKDLVGKTFVVTGAGSGIGRATALLLANQGANIGLLDLTTPEKVAEEVTKKGCSCIAIACNVQLAAEVDHAIKLVVDEFGVLDGAANMAGIASTKKTPPGKFAVAILEDDDWDTILSTNLDGVKNCLRAELQNMKDGGSVINCSSTAGQYGPPNSGPYAASKWGVIGLTKSVAKEVGQRGIRVNAIAPGVVATALTDFVNPKRDVFVASTALGRIGQAEEIARANLFLLSDTSSFMTASVLNVDGGYFF